MITEQQPTGTHQGARPDPWVARRRLLLMIDGSFLTVAGTGQIALELLSYYAGTGPHQDIFQGSPHILGWVAAHGLAALIGLLIVTVGAWDGSRLWNGFAIAVHMLLAAANIAFWSSFTAFEMAGTGLLATAAHLLFIVAHAVSIAAPRPPMPR